MGTKPKEQADEEIKIMMERFFKTRKAIVDYCDANKRPRGTAGKIPCPCCESGEVHFSRASINGHIHAKCTTPNCVSWIE